MRVEGGYTFPAGIERVYEALTTAEGLERTLPGCERLIQLGPARGDGAASFEARLRLDGDAVTVRLAFAAARRPAHARFEIELFLASGTLRGRGLFDLVDQGTHTVGAYVLDLKDAGDDLATTPSPERAQVFIQGLCDALARRLREEALVADAPALRPGIAVRTPRGRIVALGMARIEPEGSAALWAERAAWMGAGLLLGVGALALVTSVARWLTERDAE